MLARKHPSATRLQSGPMASMSPDLSLAVSNAATQERMNGSEVGATPLLDTMMEEDEDTLPGGIELQEIHGSCTLGSGVVLMKGDSDGRRYEVSTLGDTTIDFRVNAQTAVIEFHHPLFVDMYNVFAADAKVNRVEFDFRTGRVSDIDITMTYGLKGSAVRGGVEGAIREGIAGLIEGSPLAEPGVNPFQADLSGWLRDTFSNGSAGEGMEDIDRSEITDMSAGGTFVSEGGSEICDGDGAGVSIGSGTTFRVEGWTRGTGEDPKLGRVTLDMSPGITLMSGGKPIASITSMQLWPGGGVDVVGFEPLGGIKTAQGIGRGIELLAVLVLAAQGAPAHGLKNIPNGASEVKLAVEHKIEESLTDALRETVKDSPNLIPGLDLGAFLGM